MVRLCGGLMVFAAALYLGTGRAGWYRSRVTCLMDWKAALAALERLLADLGWSTPDALDQLARQDSTLQKVFAHCCRRLREGGEQPFAQLWADAMNQGQQPLRKEELDILIRLGEVLGRYDGDQQGAALREASRALDRQLESAREDRQRLGRMYCVLGASAGALLVIMLL